MVSIDEIVRAAEKAQETAHAAAEAAKVGSMRGGSTGMLLYGRTPNGQCARKAYLRFKGIDVSDIEPNRRLMFDAGLRNEDSWAETIAVGIKEQGLDLVIKREEEVQVAWKLKDGTPVSGRPDIVLMRPDGTPELGLELKLVCSLWTAKDLIVYGEPKMPHLLQAGHYLRQMSLGNYLDGKPNPDLRWEIHYTNRVDFAISGEGWQRALFAKAPPHYMEWRTDAKGNNNPLKVLPFRMGFEIKFTPQGQLLYRRIGTPEHPADGAWNYSVVTWDSIENFFDVVANIDAAGELPPRPALVSVLGEKGNYSPCSALYCPLSATCDRHEKNLKLWMKEAEEVGKELEKLNGVR